MQWDIFCKVIDNYGDVGVCWRLARDLASRGHRIRLWLDDPAPLAWMAPAAAEAQPGVTILHWPGEAEASGTTWPAPGDVVIEAFGCELPQGFVAGMARAPAAPAWVNLEYLTAEDYAAKCHRLTSPVMHGAGKGLVKHFFYPGFTPGTGGLLREPDLAQTRHGFDAASWRAQWTPAQASPALQPPDRPSDGRIWVSLFCYEPRGLTDLLQQLMARPSPTTLLVTAGRASSAVQDILAKNRHFGNIDKESLLSISYLPMLSQAEFDHLLWACDLNFVRGEDSLVRALWAGKPLVWQIYPQDDDAHHDKLRAFLRTFNATPAFEDWHLRWNGLTDDALPPIDALLSDPTVQQASLALRQHDDLGSQLLDFVRVQRQGHGHSQAKKS